MLRSFSRTLVHCRTICPHFCIRQELTLDRLIVKQLSTSFKKPVKKVERIFLNDQNGKPLGEKAKAEAEFLATKNGFQLVLDTGCKVHHKFPTYKLTSPVGELKAEERPEGKANEMSEEKDNEMPEARTRRREKSSSKPTVQITETKQVVMKCSISDHDLIQKVDQIKKFTDNLSQVKVYVSGNGNKQLMEQLYAKLEGQLLDYRILQKILKGNALKFIVQPDPLKLDLYKERAKVEGQSNSHKRTNELDEGVVIDMNDEELEKLINEKLNKK